VNILDISACLLVMGLNVERWGWDGAEAGGLEIWGEGKANANVFGLSSASSSSLCSGCSCMLVGVEAPVVANSETVTDMMIEDE